MKKKYVHIKEFQLTKLILDKLDIDMEDAGELYYGVLPLTMKSKFLTLVDYKDLINYNNSNMIPIRPLTNVNHAQYLMNLFSEVRNCDILFEYEEEKEGKLKGELKITYPKKIVTIKFYGVQSMATLMCGTLLKVLLSREEFSKKLSDIFKVDKKIIESKTKKVAKEIKNG